MGIDYLIRNRGLKFGDESGALFSYNYLYNYLTRTESLRLRPKRCRPSYIVRERLFKTIITLFVIRAYCREAKRCRPNLLSMIYAYEVNWEHLGEKGVIARTRGSIY